MNEDGGDGSDGFGWVAPLAILLLRIPRHKCRKGTNGDTYLIGLGHYNATEEGKPRNMPLDANRRRKTQRSGSGDAHCKKKRRCCVFRLESNEILTRRKKTSPRRFWGLAESQPLYVSLVFLLIAQDTLTKSIAWISKSPSSDATCRHGHGHGHGHGHVTVTVTSRSRSRLRFQVTRSK